MSKPRVAFVSDAVEFGGAEVYMAALAEALAERHDFVALVGDAAPADTRRLLESAGVEVRAVAGLTRRAGPRAIGRLVAAIADLDPAIVHVNAADHGDAAGALLGAWLCRRPTVVTVHVLLPARPRHRDAVSFLALRRASRVIVVAEGMAQPLRARGLEPIVVRNGLPVPEPDPDARSLLGLDAESFAVGGVGRLSAQKGWDVLCRAAPLVRERLPAAVFVVVGEGPEQEALSRIDACGHVRFVGARPRASSLLHAFDVLAIPSRFEGLPLVAIEGMLAGVAIVGSTASGLPEAVGDAGVLVPPDDPPALAEGILRLALDDELRQGLAAAGRRRSEQRFGIERMAAETFAVYESLLA